MNAADVKGWNSDPCHQIEQAYRQILTQEMQDMAFCNFDLPVYCSPCVIYENQWMGVLLTPWTLSLLLFPGPGQQWEQRQECDKLAVTINDMHFTFIVNEHQQLGQYLASSLLSPVKEIANVESSKQLVRDIMNKLTQIPLHVTEHVDLSRRDLLDKLRHPAPRKHSVDHR